MICSQVVVPYNLSARISLHVPGQSNRLKTSNSSVIANAASVDSSPVLPETNQRIFTQKKNIAVGTLAACALTLSIGLATPSVASGSEVEPVYFGNGCFWGRQYDFIKAEEEMGRQNKDISAVVGYAGGKLKSPDGKVCYYYTTEKDTVYERLGHAEVVQVELRGENQSTKEDEFRKYAKTYFSQFRRLPDGRMQRQDPQDAGPGYRNVVGIPGGTRSPLYQILQEENANNMQLLEGSGNEYRNGKPMEGDLINTVWIVDSTSLPFYQAEVYHQFHNGLGKLFPASYTKDLKQQAIENKIVTETGCPEYFFLGS